MARDYLKRGKNSAMLTIKGFGEFADLLNQLEKKGIENAAEKTFNEMTNTLSATLREKSAEAELPQDLIDAISEYKVVGGNGGNHFFYSIGWRRNEPDTFLKVCWLNYGTPERYTNNDEFRGKITPRYFISNTKRSVKAKFNARMKEMQKELFKGLK